jgi:hypothetical protein
MTTTEPIWTLTAGLPAVLLPVRIETRFSGANLLLRIYPDDIHIDTHEPGLTTDEAAAGGQYWQDMAGAGADAAHQTAAWITLAARFGPERAAWIATATQPGAPAPGSRAGAWTQPPYARCLPSRWHVTGYLGGSAVFSVTGSPITDPLPAGPSPAAPAPAAAGTAPVDPGMLWMTDFTAAQAAGMALTIPLPAAVQAGGLDRLVVCGVRDDLLPAQAQAGFTALLAAHYYTRGLGFAPVGTPTNHTPGAPSGYDPGNPAYSLGYQVLPGAAPAEPAAGTGAAALAAALGLRPAAPTALAWLGAGGTGADSAQSWMNAAVWPATFGYFLYQLMADTFTLDQVAAVRRHFIDHVRALGHLPALRAGRQPYAVLPVLRMDRWAPTSADTAVDRQIVGVCNGLTPIWQRAAGRLPRAVAGAAADPNTNLLRLLSMEPASRTYQARNMLGADYVTNLWRFMRLQLDANWQADGEAAASALLTGLGYQITPRQLGSVFAASAYPVGGEVLLSNAADLGFLASQDGQGLHTAVQGPVGVTSLGYRILRHSAMIAYWSAAIAVQRRAGLLSPPLHQEAELVDIGVTQTPTIWRQLGGQVFVPRSDGSQQLVPLNGYLFNPGSYNTGYTDPLLADLTEFRQDLTSLAALPAAELDTLLRGSLDLAVHRLDAWHTSSAAKRLGALRQAQPAGMHIGGYGFVEDLRPAPARTPVTPPPGETGPLYQDPANTGFVHAPSPAHARTAAILRSGWLSRGGPSGDGSLAVDLSSRRVHLARNLLDGVRNGQRLGALLGYRFERGLHDSPVPALDAYLPVFRALAPLSATQLTPGGGSSVQAAATDVVDGLALDQLFRAGQIPFPAQGTPPSPGALPSLGTPEQAAVAAVLADLDAAVDAVGDLTLAESLHHTVLGNPVRAGATLAALATGAQPAPDPDVGRTPRTGVTHTYRIAIAANPAAGDATVWTTDARQRRAQAEPVLNRWAAQVLGDPARVRCRCSYSAADGSLLGTDQFTLDQLQLSPLDVMYLAGPPGAAGPAELEQRLRGAFTARRAALGVPAGTVPVLDLGRDPSWGMAQLSITELLELARAGRAVLTAGRALTGADLTGPGLAAAGAVDSGELSSRAGAAVQALTALQANWPGMTATTATLRDALLRAAHFGVLGAVPVTFEDTPADQQSLAAQAGSVAADIGTRLTAAAAVSDPAAQLQAVFGPDFAVLPHVTGAGGAALAPAIAGLHGTDPLATVTWLARLSRVRAGAARLHSVITGAEAAGGTAQPALTLAQLPYAPGDAWVAGPFPAGQRPSGTRLALALHTTGPLDVTAPVAGWLVDEWAEVVPDAVHTTGLAFESVTPGACAPQAILLAITPDASPTWTPDLLTATVAQALDLARVRAVDPESLDEVGHFLPALYFAANLFGDTAATDFTLARPPQ